MINLIKADLYKETRKRSFKVMLLLIIFVSILYVCLINNGKEDISYVNESPLMNKEEYLSVNKYGSYEEYKKDYLSYQNEVSINNKLAVINRSNKAKDVLDKSSIILYLLGLVIIFKAFHSFGQDYSFKTIRYVFQSSHSRESILMSKIISLILISLLYYIISMFLLLITTCLLTNINVFGLKHVVYYSNSFIKIPYIIYYLRYFVFLLPILFMIIFTTLLTILFKGNNISLVISIIVYLFSITFFNIGITHNIRILSYTFLPYLDMSYYLDINSFYLSNIVFNINNNLSNGVIILIIYSLIFLVVSFILYNRDVD